ncbi:protein FRA10AC1 homolog isoform X2 [Eurytemora carolleeae]|uniref:protein FRA10AC1 homolog isoform X2 n=1 Tax=Eurytemora carolleeae TaxID=1294199 RepID=UPI000C76F692|nr:protein FRA10AC1 homolog isoform X2 [Eurytemora carolleeae]|eukprot:XP_023329740.1 protein FRA10AC1 homolog isoform X2 [Eurytemora affinis]
MSEGELRFDLRREAQDDGGYDSTNEEDEYSKASKKARYDLTSKGKRDPRRKAKGSKEVLRVEASLEEGRKQRQDIITLTAFDRHKQLVNTYQLYYKGATDTLQRDTSRDKRDADVIKEHHRFLWKEGDGEDSWEVQLARRYYDKLFKEYCIIDLSRYKENKFGMRWRLEKEVVLGKGQFVCGNKKCDEVKKLS